MADIVTKAEELSNAKKFKEALEFLKEEHEKNPTDIEIWWRLARAYFDVAEQETDHENKKENLKKGLEVIEAALVADDKHYAIHKWWAVLTSSYGEFLGTKEKIQNAFQIKEHALKALEANPSDSTTLHLLGRWCYSVANISWIERTAASAIFATPPTSSFEEAIDYFLKAQEFAPKFIRNALFIGDSYTHLKQSDKAQEWFQKAAAIPVDRVADQKYSDEAKQRLEKKSSWW